MFPIQNRNNRKNNTTSTRVINEGLHNLKELSSALVVLTFPRGKFEIYKMFDNFRLLMDQTLIFMLLMFEKKTCNLEFDALFLFNLNDSFPSETHFPIEITSVLHLDTEQPTLGEKQQHFIFCKQIVQIFFNT